MSPESDSTKSSADQSIEGLLERFVYYPVGLLSAVVSAAPKAAESGKALVEGQVKTAEFLGKMTIGYVKSRVQGPEDVVREVGSVVLNVLGDRLPSSITDLLSKTVFQSSPSQSTTHSDVESDQVNPIGEVADPQETVKTESEKKEDSEGVRVGSLDSYDSLTASQVITQLGELSSTQLSEIEVHELEHRRRRTILAKISQLRESRSRSE
jgi:hypothetical protein